LRRALASFDGRLFPDEPRYAAELRRLLLPECRSVLDVGCGNEGRLLQLVPGIPDAVGVDAQVPTTGPHAAYRQLDIRSLADAFEDRSFDAVVALDVIEHLTREEGWGLLDAMEAIASRRVIVFTPNGFLPQPPAPDNPYQEHLSGWSTPDFERRGYRVTGVNGWKPLRGPYAEPRWRPRSLWSRLSMLTEPLVDAKPQHAFQLLCVKDVEAATDEV